MKFTLTGSLGNISKPLAGLLIRAGHKVRVISNNPDRRQSIVAMGAEAAIGSVMDIDFLARAFEGADGIYTMVPPNFAVTDYRRYLSQVGTHYAEAITRSGVDKVVNLSSIGAHLAEGTGPISGLHDVENTLNALQEVDIVHLRASYFYTNFYGNVEMIKGMNVIGGNYPASSRMVMVHPKDVADAAAKFLVNGFTGKSFRYVSGDDRTLGEVATALGSAIGSPQLPWVEFTDEQAYQGMTQAGIPPALADVYTEMGTAIRKGILWEDYDRHSDVERGRIKLEDFAAEFGAAFS